MSQRKPITCSDCRDVDRRSFIKTVGGVALAGAAGSVLFDPRFAHAAPTPQSTAETAVGRFYASLSPPQREKICLPFNHELRSRISANWHVTEPVIGDDFYTADQRKTIEEIVKNVMSEEGYERLQRQMDDDDGGLQNYSVAVFGQPGSGKFEWELTGRHLTLRADGDSVDKAAFGGPIIYGHGEEDDLSKNLFHYQTQRANEVFRALDPKQVEVALLKDAPQEAAVELQGQSGQFPGIRIGQLSADQQQLVRATIKALLDPYRSEDVEEAVSLVHSAGGFEQLHMAFYQEGDLQSDKVWDIWRVEGPALVWHFRGAPHVHAYINIGVKNAS
jgi:hypothetical protein